MALVALPSSARAPIDPRKSLENAIQGFESVLTDDERKRFQHIKSIPDAGAVMTFTAQLDDSTRSRKGRSIASRLHSVLQSVREFSAFVDTLVSSHPEIAALVWGSVQLTMLIVVNYTSYFEALSNLFLGFKTHCPRFAEYQALYPTSPRLREALCNFHASIIRCWQKQLVNALWQSFDEEFKPDAVDIQRCGDEVREEIAFAKAQADRQHQELQKKEGEAAKQRLGSFMSLSKNKLDMIKEMQLQRDQIKSRNQRQQLLESLSSYDYLSPFRVACKKRHYGTAQWMFSTSEFKRWNEKTNSSLLWCAGKIGSGKTIITASAIQHVFANKGSNECVAYFFHPYILYKDTQSLKAETIIRSIIRQSLDPVTLSKEMETRLKNMDQNMFSELEDLVALFRRRIALSKSFYIFLDAVDECEPAERRVLLDTLSSLGTAASGLRIFLASGESLSVELRGMFPQMERISTASAGASSDIGLYIGEALQERKQNGNLVVGDPSLFEEIKCALAQHADGMFLWVTYLIDELCIQYCDDDIRKSLGSLPKDLKETYYRALSRIVSRQTTAVAQEIFPWVTVAKRHLTLDELCEAMSINIGQSYSKPERRVNGMDRIISWCANLLHVDEENGSVQFAHRTIYDFITGRCSKPGFADFHVDLEEADHYAGEICLTYLHFNDFMTTLARRPQPSRRIMPAAIAPTALGHQSKTAKSISKFIDFSSKHQKSTTNRNMIGILASYKRASANETLDTLQQAHPFLRYAAEHWISHTTMFRDGRSTTWDLWKHVITHGHGLAQKPWPEQEFDSAQSGILRWAYQARHYALIRLIDSCEGSPKSEISQMMAKSAAEGDIEVLGILLERGKSMHSINMSLRAASGGGYLDVAERLLAAGANVNVGLAGRGGRTALQAASEGGHLEVVQRLLIAGANVNAAAAAQERRTALQAASEGGHLDVVEQLLAAKANVNATAAEYRGRTALQAASEVGHLEVVERLLAAGANANAAAAKYSGRTALEAASAGGHLEVVERLLAAKDNVNAAAAAGGRTALQAASEGGHFEVVERLLAAGANINAAAAKYSGHTALQAASEGGHLEVVERLLTVGANVNAAAEEGRTALQAASEGGYLDVVERLLDAKANANAAAAAQEGRTALQAASKGGHLDVVERLLTAGANVNAYGGNTALQAASGGGHLEVVERLLTVGANVNAAAAAVRGRTALQAASEGGHLEVVKRLLAAGADVNAAAATVRGRTALEAASEGGHLEVVEQLKHPGANPKL